MVIGSTLQHVGSLIELEHDNLSVK